MAAIALKQAAIPTAAASNTMSIALSRGHVSRSRFPNFTPRDAFPIPASIPKSYFLGHHRAGLERMKSLLGTIDVVVECRDYRVPLTGSNELFEKELVGFGSTNRSHSAWKGRLKGSSVDGGEKKRVIVFTKWDLGIKDKKDPQARNRDDLLRNMYEPTPVHFSSTKPTKWINPRRPNAKSEIHPTTARALLDIFKQYARDNFSLTGHRVLIAGMPNVGKSTLLNSLRATGLPGRSRGKVAKTGAQPGVTRKVGTGVKILDAQDCLDLDSSSTESPGNVAKGEGVYLHDTPGVFMPYVPNPLSMLKLALVGAVKDSLVDPITLADFVLYNVNLRADPSVYTAYTNGQPTNDIGVLLEGVAKQTGKLKKTRKDDPTAPVRKGAVEVDWEGAAMWVVQKWRVGELGRFVLDDVEETSLDADVSGDGSSAGVSFNQAKKLEKERRSEAAKARRSAKS